MRRCHFSLRERVMSAVVVFSSHAGGSLLNAGFARLHVLSEGFLGDLGRFRGTRWSVFINVTVLQILFDGGIWKFLSSDVLRCADEEQPASWRTSDLQTEGAVRADFKQHETFKNNWEDLGSCFWSSEGFLILLFIIIFPTCRSQIWNNRGNTSTRTFHTPNELESAALKCERAASTRLRTEPDAQPVFCVITWTQGYKKQSVPLAVTCFFSPALFIFSSVFSKKREKKLSPILPLSGH